MKTLLILRHAKSSWKAAGLEDHDRPLNKRGRNDAPRMGTLVASLDVAPQRILSSTAVRTRETTRLVTDQFGFDVDVRFEDALYLASAGDIVTTIRASAEADPTVDVLMVVGHNPGSEQLVRRLTGEEETMPTAALARIELPIASWDELRLTTPGRLMGLWRPKALG